ncbi:MAG: restriction endonuclease subunit S [Clostridia bacterium]|nr:restriction endonuclease subunit S [Clostridia bacterium]
MKYKLEEICEIVSGSTPKTSVEEYWNGDIKWITPAELTDDSYIIEDSARKLSELGVKKTGLTPFPAGTVILSSRAPIGKVAIAGCEMYCNQGFKNLICSDKINNKYLYWFLKGNTAFLNSLGRGATFKEISKGIVGNIEINVPDVVDQERAVVNLEKLSEIIKLRKKELEELDNLIKARFVELFGDPVLNQKNFPVYRMDEVVEFQGGSQPDKKYFEYEPKEDNIRLIQIRDYKTDKYITYIPKSLAKRFCTAEDIMIGRYGPPIFQILQGIEGSFNVALMKATPKMGNREFVRWFLKQDCLLNYLEGMSQRTAGQDGIQMDKLKAYPFPIPPIELQNEFELLVKQVDKSKVVIQKALTETQTLFDSLMQEYFG